MGASEGSWVKKNHSNFTMQQHLWAVKSEGLLTCQHPRGHGLPWPAGSVASGEQAQGNPWDSAEPLLRKVSFFFEKCEKGDKLKSQLHQLKRLFFGRKLINMTLKYAICIMFPLIRYFHYCHKIKMTDPNSRDLLPAPSWVESLQ